MFPSARLLVLAILMLPAPVAAQAPPLLLSWGSHGNGDNQFDDPRKLSVDATGEVYVPDFILSRVQVFDANGVFLRKWGSFGAVNTNWNEPRDSAIDGSGNVYVTDINSVRKFTRDGTFITRWGVSGSGDGQFNSPDDIAIDPGNNVYVLDAGNCRVQKFTS